MSFEKMQQVFREADCLFSMEQVTHAIKRLADEISTELGDADPLVLVVMNGGLVFAGQLLPQLEFPLQVDYLHASRYGNETQGTTLQWRVKPTVPMQGRQVLIVDDILDATSNTETLGKKVGQDDANAKNTYVRVHGIEASRERASELTQEAEEALDALGGNCGFLVELTRQLERRIH